MREVRWVFSFFLALLVHGMVLGGFFFWRPGFRHSIVYSPSFSVSLYAHVPGKTGHARPPVVKKEKHRVVSKLPPKAPALPRKSEKKAWKVKEKKKVSPRKKVSRKKVTRKTSRIKKKGKISRRRTAAQEKAILAKALAKLSREVSGEGGVSREAVELKYKEYYDEIWRRVKASWILPEEVISSGEDLMTVVVVRIGRQGELLEMKLEESSGNRLFDQSCLRAVKKAAPFPPLPRDYPQKYMELGLRFRPWE